MIISKNRSYKSLLPTSEELCSDKAQINYEFYGVGYTIHQILHEVHGNKTKLSGKDLAILVSTSMICSLRNHTVQYYSFGENWGNSHLAHPNNCLPNLSLVVYFEEIVTFQWKLRGASVEVMTSLDGQPTSPENLCSHSCGSPIFKCSQQVQRTATIWSTQCIWSYPQTQTLYPAFSIQNGASGEANPPSNAAHHISQRQIDQSLLKLTRSLMLFSLVPLRNS